MLFFIMDLARFLRLTPIEKKISYNITLINSNVRWTQLIDNLIFI